MAEDKQIPLWKIIPMDAVVQLAIYQYSQYGTKLDILINKPPPVPDDNIFVERLEDIDRLMRQPPRKNRGDND